MSIERIAFATGRDTAPELVLAARALVAPLAARGASASVVEEVWPDALDARLAIVTLGETDVIAPPPHWNLSLAADALELRCGAELRGRAPIPLQIPPPDRLPGERILVRGAAASDRRLRLVARLLAALRERRSRAKVVCWGPLPEEMLRARVVDEVHLDPGPDELARLLATSRCLADPVAESDPASSFLALGRAAGIPTAGFGSSAARTAGFDEWSADAFAEAVLSAMTAERTPPPPADPAADLIVESLGVVR